MYGSGRPGLNKYGHTSTGAGSSGRRGSPGGSGDTNTNIYIGGSNGRHAGTNFTNANASGTGCTGIRVGTDGDGQVLRTMIPSSMDSGILNKPPSTCYSHDTCERDYPERT